MGKKVREYKSGDFIFAKVKGYPAWPARVQKLNGKKYYVYFYGTGETANLPPTMIFDYAENKDKFLTKMVKRRDFRDGVKQIEHDFANNVPLEQVIGALPEAPSDATANDTMDDTANDTMDVTADTTAADETMADDTTVNASTNDAAVEDSDDTGTLVIDEGKQKGKKGKVEAKAKETPAKPAKEPKTPRGKAKKEESKEEDEEAKKEEEIVSRSGRKIRPKRYIDEQTEENATLPSPAPKKRRGASPGPAPDKEKEKEKNAESKEKVPEKNIKQFNAVKQSELEDLKEPFKPDVNSKVIANIKSCLSEVMMPKIVPTFGKKEIVKKCDNKPITKPKKFRPPTKVAQNTTKTNEKVIDTEIDTLPQHLPPTICDNLNQSAIYTNEMINLTPTTYLTSVGPEIYTNFNPVSNDQNICAALCNTDINFTGNGQENTNICYENSQSAGSIKKSKSKNIGNIISSSLFVLNDEEIVPLISQESDNSSIKCLSRNQSICSVTSLTKTYKNLDFNSFKENKGIKENNCIDNSNHRIPQGDDYLNLFRNNNCEKFERNVAMKDAEKENILITYLPSGQYVGIKLFQARPAGFKNEAARLQWDKQAASNAVTLKMQLEKGQITSQSVVAQLVTDLNLTDEEKATLDKERETEEKKSRVQFLKTEMKLIELDAKIKTCLCLEKADTDMCLKLLDEFMELDVKPLMLLKHPTCLETIKRMRAYVGNTPSWELSESAAHVFNKQASNIRKQADVMYKKMKELFTTPEGLSFWEFFTERVLQFKKVTSKLTADELLEMIHEPIGMSSPTSHTMKTAVEAANEDEQQPEDTSEEPPQKKKATPAKNKKATNNTPSKQPLKRQSSRKLQQEEKEKEKETNKEKDETPKSDQPENSEEAESSKAETETSEKAQGESTEKTAESTEEPAKEAVNTSEETKEDAKEENDKEAERVTAPNDKSEKEVEKSSQESEKEKPEKQEVEPRAIRSRESKKTEAPPPRSPAKRKSKF
ncbi:unnamed protein product [Arctia plantaginis]|uniref:PWWP domain-containing protein n=1 Tax=Arctia plantaginis TaxID=874455 RepID=A0A8S1AB42_ARCPL|nr:unnamed protein product [Arctia plantaginis]